MNRFALALALLCLCEGSDKLTFRRARAEGRRASSSFTCLQEIDVRSFFSAHNPLAHGSELLRLVFHDSLDFHNLRTREGDRVDYAGGVDGCLFAGLKKDGSLNEGHNDGLNHAMRKIKRAKSRFGDLTLSDMLVAGSIAALEEDASGPFIPMTWGRSDFQDCANKTGNSNERKFPISKPNASSEWFINSSPDIKTFNESETFHTFDVLSYNRRDMVALMGAHSYGMVSFCSRQLNKVEVGNHCDGHVEKSYGLTGSKATGKRMIIQHQYDDGAFWDQTPDCFDNRYYKTFSKAHFASSDVCCGKCKGDGSCTARDNPGDVCDKTHRWCRSDWPKGKPTMRNMYDYAFSNSSNPDPLSGNQDATKEGQHRFRKSPIFRTAPEWSMLSKDSNVAVIQEFADNETAFFDAFQSAFVKLISMVPTPEALGTCQAVSCTATVDGFACGDRKFVADELACPAAAEGASCSLVGAVGKRGVINCGESDRLCCMGSACRRSLRAWSHRQGTEMASCPVAAIVGDTAIESNEEQGNMTEDELLGRINPTCAL